VGFRPFIYRLAIKNHVNGWIANVTSGVDMKLEGESFALSLFLEEMRAKAPSVSHIEEIMTTVDIPESCTDFRILDSRDLSDETSEISPDIAVCSECLSDMQVPGHRMAYPFINCTNCGPRFSIIYDFPYDRENTTMRPFVMCNTCQQEYSDLLSRRFHAQPVACNACGPLYTLIAGAGKITDQTAIIDSICTIINHGGVIALKGTGGFYFMCNALNDMAVGRLREIKKREGKPFAVMFRDIQSIKKYGFVSREEENLLTSWQRPIVILKERQSLGFSVSKGLPTIGAFLPYMPLHYLIFGRSSLTALVCTSGNLTDEPIVVDNSEAMKLLAPLTDALVIYNRDIYNRIDDSVLRVVSQRKTILRRSRGYVPLPISCKGDVSGIMAAGAELSNCFCVGKGHRAYLSQHIGDLKNHSTMVFYEQALERFLKLFRIRPQLVAVDMHPDYLSTLFMLQLGLPYVKIQHHHAHVASCMAEHGLDEKVIGLAFDGTGYGTDGNTWGSEFLVCDFVHFQRMSHFAYMPMPGGDKAALEPWRMGLSLLYQTFGPEARNMNLSFYGQIEPSKREGVWMALEKSINTPLTSGAGRLFDAVAAITGLCIHPDFHAEAPMRLEHEASEDIDDCYDFEISNAISFLPTIKQICADLTEGVDPGHISARFHNTLAEASLQQIQKIASATGLRKVVLTGGSFQNKYLSEVLERKLRKDNFAVYTHSEVPCHDGGLALGQLMIAAAKANRE
jgi:hydrogenase maturation protein HypF